MLNSTEPQRSTSHPENVGKYMKQITKDPLSAGMTNEAIEQIARNYTALDLRRIRNENKAAQYKELSQTDSLTGFFLRRYIFGDETTENKKSGQLEAEFDRAIRHQHDLVVAVIDLDNFKVVNDTFGHPRGDELIKTLARAVTETLRKEDIKARIGGDEFCLIFPENNIDQIKIVIERIRKEYLEAQKKSFQDMPLQSLSIGLSSIGSNKPTNQDELMVFADKALYKAKHAGRNRVIVYNREEFEGQK